MIPMRFMVRILLGTPVGRQIYTIAGQHLDAT